MTDLFTTGLALAGGAFVLSRAFESWARHKRVHVQLAAAPATPPSLYPRINKDACICSGACIDACPEGDVIALVHGRPQLVRASACVGHSDCLRSCPVSAIELVLGSAARAVEVPVASGSFETTVPGIYVAGEVTGIGLIHNAVAQGRQAAVAALDGTRHGCDYDLIVVGAGPAGIGAALEAKRRGARCVVLEKGALGGAMRSYPRQKIVMTAPLDLPGIGKIKLRRTSKEALLELFDDIVRRAGLAIVENAEVTATQRTDGGLRVETAAGTMTARRVILAIGRRGAPRRLAAPGATLPHVVYEVPDPAQHARAAVAVVGGGDSAVELALALAAAGATVTLVHRGDDFGRCKPDNQAALTVARSSGHVEVITGGVVRGVTAEHLEVSCGHATRTVRAGVVACCLGAELPSGWLRGLGIALRELRGEPLVSG